MGKEFSCVREQVEQSAVKYLTGAPIMSVHFGGAPFRPYEGYHFGDEKVHGHDPEGTTPRTNLEEHSESSEKQFCQPEAFKTACDIE